MCKIYNDDNDDNDDNDNNNVCGIIFLYGNDK